MTLADKYNKRDQIIKGLTPNYGQCSKCKKFVPKEILVFISDAKLGSAKIEYHLCPKCSKEEDDARGF